MDRARFAEAREFLAGRLPETRLITARSLAKNSKHKVYLKLENELPTGSFKVRGALYALHVNMLQRPVAEVIASSTGNHGAAVAYAAKLLGCRRGATRQKEGTSSGWVRPSSRREPSI